MVDQTATPDANNQNVQTDQDRTAGDSHDAPVNLTQSALNSLIANEIRKERQRYSDYEDLKAKAARLAELEQAEMSELDKLKKQLADKDALIASAQQAADAERLNSLRLRVGQEHNLPVEIAQRLIGEDEETIRADAVKMQALIKVEAPRVPNIDATAGGGQSSTGGGSGKLSPGQIAAARAAGMTEDDYRAALNSMKGAQEKDK